MTGHYRASKIMPEVISKYPEITIKVLREAGARCGEGLPQKILTKCPPERFCSLPTGEVCVYGVDEIGKMTQITSQEISQQISKEPKAEIPKPTVLDLSLAILIFLIAFFLGVLFQKRFMKKK